MKQRVMGLNPLLASQSMTNSVNPAVNVVTLFYQQKLKAVKGEGYRTNSMYWDRYVSANSADQDQTACF